MSPKGIPLPGRRVGEGILDGKLIDADFFTDSIWTPFVRGYVFSAITTVSGTGTLDIKIQGSPAANMPWYDLFSFPQVELSARHDFKVMDRYLTKLIRFALIVDGGSPQFTTTIWAIPKADQEEPRLYHDEPII